MECPICGHETRAERLFCSHCGTTLEDKPRWVGQLVIISEPLNAQHRQRREGLLNYRGFDQRGGRRFASRPVSIGRHSSNDMVVTDPLVSARHARITLAEEGFWIEDWGSTNGTYVNGEQITTRHPLVDGDLIQMGATILEFRQQRIERNEEVNNMTKSTH